MRGLKTAFFCLLFLPYLTCVGSLPLRSSPLIKTGQRIHLLTRIFINQITIHQYLKIFAVKVPRSLIGSPEFGLPRDVHFELVSRVHYSSPSSSSGPQHHGDMVPAGITGGTTLYIHSHNKTALSQTKIFLINN